jgi:calcineurin-like phosphoesterase family protein
MSILRGFTTIEDHDQFIIDSWNSVVNKRDTVYLLGDITMEKSHSYPLLNKLLGIKKVILGNHDKPSHIPELLKYVNSVCGAYKLKSYILTHIPIHPNEFHRFIHNIHGHVHENSIQDSRYVNVSCEAVNYKPYLIT